MDNFHLYVVLSVMICLLGALYFAFPAIYRNWLKDSRLLSGMTAERFHYYIVPLLTVFAICTTFVAFMAQTEFNKFERGRRIAEWGERQVFELIRMHAREVDNLKVTGSRNGHAAEGNRAFHFMFYEYRSMKCLLDSIAATSSWDTLRRKRPDLNKELAIIAFDCFFDGISRGENTHLKEKIISRFGPVYNELLNEYIVLIGELQEINENRFSQTRRWYMHKNPNEAIVSAKEQMIGRTKFLDDYLRADHAFLFADGHKPELEAHMRLLKVIFKQLSNLPMEEEEKRDYIDMLRCQLSPHELLVVFLYCYADDELEWFSKGYLNNQVKCKLNMVGDLEWGLIEELKISDYKEYVSGDEKALDSLKKVRRERVK